MRNIRVIETIPALMKTYPRIPFERAIKLRPRASPIEVERYFTLLFEQDLDDWIKSGIKAPEIDDINGALNETSLKKLDCVDSFSRCSGWNKNVYSGKFDSCGYLAPFYLWKRYIDESEYEEGLNIFMDQY